MSNNIFTIDDYFLIDFNRCKSKKKAAQYQNGKMFMQTFMRLMDTAMRRYKLEGLPETVSERVVLQALICNCNVTFFKDPKFGDNVLALPGYPSGKGFNVNGDPISSWVYAKNGRINQEIDLYVKGAEEAPKMNEGSIYTDLAQNPKGVMVWENETRYPFIETVLYYAACISDTYRTIDTDRMWLKTPFVPICEESMVPAMKEFFNKIVANNDFIPVSTGIHETDKIDFHDINGMDTNIKAAMELIDWYEQKFREACGFKSNAQVDKKGENLTEDEVCMSLDYTEKTTNDLIDYLQQQFDFVNEQLGTSIKVREVEGDEDANTNNKADGEHDISGSDSTRVQEA